MTQRLAMTSILIPGGLHRAKVLKALNSHIAPVLARMFNLSLQTAQVPDNWRRAIVTPVAKIPRTTDPRQFRSISLTSVVCKLLNEKLLSHLSQFSLLTTRQHGFLPHRSTLTNLFPLKKRLLDGLMKGTQSKLSTWISPVVNQCLSKSPSPTH